MSELWGELRREFWIGLICLDEEERAVDIRDDAAKRTVHRNLEHKARAWPD